MSEPYICTERAALKISQWLRTRGGIAIWRSINLSNPGGSWTTPLQNEDGTTATKPTWEAATDPERVIVDPAEVIVSRDIEVKRFYVAVRQGTQGLSWKVTDGGSRRIRAAVAKAGEGAFHVFDYGTQEAVIMRPDKLTPLPQWEIEHPTVEQRTKEQGESAWG